MQHKAIDLYVSYFHLIQKGRREKEKGKLNEWRKKKSSLYKLVTFFLYSFVLCLYFFTVQCFEHDHQIRI